MINVLTGEPAIMPREETIVDYAINEMDLLTWLRSYLPRVRLTRNGGIRFARIGRLQLSFCVCRNGSAAK